MQEFISYVLLSTSCFVIFLSHVILSQNFIETNTKPSEMDILTRKITLVFRVIRLFLDVFLAVSVVRCVRFYSLKKTGAERNATTVSDDQDAGAVHKKRTNLCSCGITSLPNW